MSPLLCTLLGCGLLAAADADKPAPLRYLRPGIDGFVLESEVAVTTTTRGATYVSRTVQGDEKMTLTIRSGPKGEVLIAEALLEKGDMRKTAILDLRGARASLKRGGTTDLFKAPAHPVVTTAADWSDVFALVRRYNATEGGKQEFTGLWIHPAKPRLALKFTIERKGSDKVTVKDNAVELKRYEVHSRSGDYLVWAQEPDGVVCKLVSKDAKTAPVVLEGYEEATRRLGTPK